MIERMPKQENRAEFLEESFDPIFELEKLKQLPREERRRAVDIYKEKLMSQKEGLAEIEELLLREFHENPDKSKEEFFNLIDKHTSNHSFSEAQRALIFDTAGEMIERRKFVKDFCDSFSDNRSIFKKLFGFTPSGSVRIEAHSLNIVVKIYNLGDFAKVSAGGFLEHRKATKGEREEELLTGGRTITPFVKGLEHSVVIINLSIETKEAINDAGIKWSYRDVLAHEEQHVFNWFLTERKILKYLDNNPLSLETAEERKDTIETLLYFIRKYEAEWDFKNEVLAFLRGGATIDQIEEMLTDQKGFYSSRHYLSITKKALKKSLGKEFEKQRSEIDLLIKKVLSTELLQIQKKALDALRELSENGVPPQRIISLLQGESLTSWPNFAWRYSSRLKEKNFSEAIS